jgi:hypothetical protein
MEENEKNEELRTTGNIRDPEEQARTATQNNEHEFPEGGLQSWLVVLGSAFAMFCSFGYINTFGFVAFDTFDIFLRGTDKRI